MGEDTTMKFTLDEIETLREAALPLMQWLNDNCHPHCTVMVDSERIELKMRSCDTGDC